VAFDILPKRGTIVWEVSPALLLVGLLSVLAVYLDERAALDDSFKPPYISDSAHKLLGSTLGFLIVFRSTLSYRRYSDGFQQFSSVGGALRNLVRSVVFELHESDPEAADRITRQGSLFFKLVHLHLKHHRDVDYSVKLIPKDLLGPGEAERLEGKKRKPLIVMGWLEYDLLALWRAKIITTRRHIYLVQVLDKLTSGFLACAKIQMMPLPFPYAQLLYLLLSAFCFTTPFIFVEDYGRWTPLPSILVALTYYGINSVGIALENPFGADVNDLPVSLIERATAIDLKHYREESIAFRGFGLVSKTQALATILERKEPAVASGAADGAVGAAAGLRRRRHRSASSSSSSSSTPPPISSSLSVTASGSDAPDNSGATGVEYSTYS